MVADWPVQGLPRGERKRFAIGVELVTEPSIIFLDEPTSGLDSREAATVMRVIKKQALQGRTVVATIHVSVFVCYCCSSAGRYSVPSLYFSLKRWSASYTMGCLRFGPMVHCVVHALKGLACRASPSRAR